MVLYVTHLQKWFINFKKISFTVNVRREETDVLFIIICNRTITAKGILDNI